jgi:hypothetical protein
MAPVSLLPSAARRGGAACHTAEHTDNHAPRCPPDAQIREPTGDTPSEGQDGGYGGDLTGLRGGGQRPCPRRDVAWR